MPRARPTPEADLTAAARIRNAALDLFAERGVKATTIRDVATAAGVSPGLIQHHFGTKAALRKAVDEFVQERALAVLTGMPEEVDIERRGELFGERMAQVVREEPTGLIYMARLVSEGDETGLAMFRAIAERGTEELRELSERGLTDPDLDLEWAALHLTVFNLATMLFEPGISRVLGEPLQSEAGIARWTAAATLMLTKAIAPRASADGPGA